MEFGWYDLAGDGKYELLLRDSSGPCCVFLTIYWQDDPGKVRFESVGEAAELSKTVKDLNGDGKKELIIWRELAEPGSWSPMADTPRWPAVYRLQGGKYVEDSRDFGNYYDTEILPQLDGRSAELSKKAAEDRGYRDGLAQAALEENKILRVLGRDPMAGLQQAYEWMNSDDPQYLQCAIATFADIGGHDEELSTAKQPLKPAIQHELAEH